MSLRNNMAWADRLRAPDQRASSRFTSLGQQPGRGDIASRAPMQRLIYPPRIEKLPASQDFNVQDFAMTLGAGAGSTITSTNLLFEVPTNMVGWLQNFTFYILTPTANTSVQFAVRINQSPVPGFDNRQNAPGVANFVLAEYNDLRVRLPMGCMVDVIATNLNANGPWTVGGLLSGWYHPPSEEQRVFGDDY